MNIDADVDVFISLFDVIIMLILIWGGYKGFVRGAIVESITLFALLAGMVVSIVTTKIIYQYFSSRSDVPDLFAVILLGSIFIGAIWFSNFVSKKVKENVGDAKKNNYHRFIGMGLGGLRYFFIIAVYVVVIYKIDVHANFLPKSEKASKLANGTEFVLTKAFPNLKMNTHSGKVTDKDTIKN